MADLNDMTPEMQRAGDAVARLSRPDAPADLTARTLARAIAGSKPVKRVIWFLRPITHPVARVAAAAMIIAMMSPMTDLNTADALGQRIEQKIIGPQVADHIEGFVDSILVMRGAPGYEQSDLDALMGVNRPHTIRRQPKAVPQMRPEA
jgi:hypothetical protein